MNKKLIIRLSMIAAIAIIVIGATTAYFSNTERSVGNTFIAGAIDLKIDNTCHYNGKECELDEKSGKYFWTETNEECFCSWGLMDLKGKAIFNFLDVKPGDYGESTISLHVDSNPAWVCAEISNVKNFENGCNPPEAKVDGTCGDTGEGQGELQDNLFFSIWMDNGAGKNACNNKKDSDETYLVENVKATNLKWPIADSQTGGVPIRDACIGVAWNVPSEVGNIIQGDSVTGDITFNAYQAKNNGSFFCNPPEGPVCGNGIIDSGETCEYPMTPNNSYCPQLPLTQCATGNKTQTRDALGNCNNVCGCVEDPFTNPMCVVGSCGATCAVDADCDDSNSGTTDTCNVASCQCQHTQDTGTITVYKVVVNNEVGTKVAGDFQMTIDTNPVAQNTPITVNVGSRTVSEADTHGHVKTYSGDCDSNGVVNVTKNSAKNCTVTNTYPYFTVTVTKVLVNDNGGNAAFGDFSLFVGAFPVTSGVSKKVAVGTYLISESGVIGYAAIFSGDCNPSTQLLTGANGDNKFCTITNDDIAPVITLVKSVVSGSALPTDFIMRVDDVPVPSGGSKSVTSNAGHIITEDDKAGYKFISMTGIGSQGSICPALLGGNVILNEGEVITCTITNTAN